MISAIAYTAVTVMVLTVAQAEPRYTESFVFPFMEKHNHAPGIVECPNGDLLVSWYRGSGERTADDVAVYGARLRKGSTAWSPEFVMADFPGFPDCNTTMMIDTHNRLCLYWPVVIANSWESAITNVLISNDYTGDGAPHWDHHGLVLLKPDKFEEQMIAKIEEAEKQFGNEIPERAAKYFAGMRERAKDLLLQRLGWQARCKPTVLPSGRILLPLYSDTFSACLMAISDDDGKTWYASGPIIGHGNIQPTVLRRNDGTLVAYMRENGIEDYIRVSESKDDGLTWGPVTNCELLNPGAGIDGVRLENGNWVLIYNDQKEGRNKLAVSLSEDEGKTWKFTRHLENQEKGSYHYPAIIQGKNGTIHAVYSYFTQNAETGKDAKSMKYAGFDEPWIRTGDPAPEEKTAARN